MDLELQREINGLIGDIHITKLAVNSVQEDMKRQLSGEMGEDMNAVLNGKIFVKPSVSEKQKFKFKLWLKRLFKMF